MRRRTDAARLKRATIEKTRRELARAERQQVRIDRLLLWIERIVERLGNSEPIIRR